MALIKCGECGRQVSDKAGKCPVCRNPIGSDDSTGNIAFEKRIEEYKKAGYILKKRNGDTVKLQKVPMSLTVISILFILFFAVVGMIIMAFGRLLLGVVITGFFSLIILISLDMSYNVYISLNKIGKVEETGYILKNK